MARSSGSGMEKVREWRGDQASEAERETEVISAGLLGVMVFVGARLVVTEGDTNTSPSDACC